MPPALICIFVAIAESERPVINEMKLASRIIINAPQRPACPTTHPMRRNKMSPKMVRTLGVNTPVNVPKRPVADKAVCWATGCPFFSMWEIIFVVSAYGGMSKNGVVGEFAMGKDRHKQLLGLNRAFLATLPAQYIG